MELGQAVGAVEVGGEGHAERAGAVQMAHGLALVVAVAVLALDGHVDTLESLLGLHVLPGAVGALGQADDDGRCSLGVCNRHDQDGANAEEKSPPRNYHVRTVMLEQV